jgi:hypothetical protein
MMQLSRLLAWCLAGVLLAGGLSACGGGGGSSSSASSTTKGYLTVGLTGGAYRGVSHVWVTVKSVALHANANQPWSSGDSSWTVLTLSTPVVVDLALTPTSGQSSVTKVIDNLQIPVGSYAQARLFVLNADDALSQVAYDKGLTYNAQVTKSDNSIVPLDMPHNALGWRVGTSISMTANGAYYMVVQADIDHSLVRFADTYAGDSFLMRPTLSAYDMWTSAALIGTIDASKVCGNSSASTSPNCASNVVVSLQSLSSDGLRYEQVRQTRVATSGLFALYPIPSATTYRVVITGEHMRTVVINDVTTATPSVLAALSYTTLGATTTSDFPSYCPISPTLISSGQTVSLSVPLSARYGPHLYVGMSLLGSAIPYEVTGTNMDPFTGGMAQALDVPQDGLDVATYSDSSSTCLLFTTGTTQNETAGKYTMTTQGTVYDDVATASTVTVAPGTVSGVYTNTALNAGASTTVHEPTRKGSIGATGTINVSVTSTLSSSYSSAYLVVSDVNGVVATTPVTAAGTYSMAVPAGANAAAQVGGGVYTVTLRAWGANSSTKPKWVRASGTVDLRSSTTASASTTLALP